MTDPTLPLASPATAESAETVLLAATPALSEEPERERPATLPRPRTRWAAIVWGLVFAAVALAGIWLTSEAARLDAALVWVGGLDAGAAVGYGLLGVGALLLVGGLVGLLRRAQLAASRR